MKKHRHDRERVRNEEEGESPGTRVLSRNPYPMKQLSLSGTRLRKCGAPAEGRMPKGLLAARPGRRATRVPRLSEALSLSKSCAGVRAQILEGQDFEKRMCADSPADSEELGAQKAAGIFKFLPQGGNPNAGGGTGQGLRVGV
eukprot:295002-Rhodomonas_salina.1